MVGSDVQIRNTKYFGAIIGLTGQMPAPPTQECGIPRVDLVGCFGDTDRQPARSKSYSLQVLASSFIVRFLLHELVS
jgi:hypothetical protein